LSQKELADALGVTQGHYSKVVRGAATLSPKLEQRMLHWLTENGQSVADDDATALRMRELAASIRNLCTELMRLADRAMSDHAGH
jgi:transcriptional regulator with XRE-family HTH domain